MLSKTPNFLQANEVNSERQGNYLVLGETGPAWVPHTVHNASKHQMTLQALSKDWESTT